MATAEETSGNSAYACEIVLSPKRKRNFEKKIKIDPETGCWNWTGFITDKGYGMFQIGRIQHLAHRLSYRVHKGAIVDWLFVCHSCDNRRCVNPDHLWLGTHTDNMQDMIKKGRGPTGDRHGLRKHPERAARGDRNGSRLYPERLKRGDEHPSRIDPSRLQSGDDHWSRRTPEKVPRGDKQPQAKLSWSKVAEIREIYSLGEISQRGLAKMFNVSQVAIGRVIRNEGWKKEWHVDQKPQGVPTLLAGEPT
jgi:hypothetical protein